MTRYVKVLTLGAFLPLLALGQAITATVVGTVTDPSGAVVPNVKVTIKNQQTNQAREVSTNNLGNYEFQFMPVGVYTLSAEAAGFQRIGVSAFALTVDQVARVDLKLTMGQTTDTVEVTASTVGMQTENATVGTVIDSRQVVELPLNGRSFVQLALLTPGVNPGTPGSITVRRLRGALGQAVGMSANGARDTQNRYYYDGIEAMDYDSYGFSFSPSIDAIQEFKVQTTDFSAEFGRSGAAVLNASLKSGSNEFHGDVWEFFRNDILDARDFFEHNCTSGVCTPAKKGELRWNQFGGTIGGPVIKNKVFFFGDFQAWRLRQGQPQSGTVPTSAETASLSTATANFQDLINGQSGTHSDALGRSFPLGTVFDPATTQQIVVNGATAFVRDPFGFSTCTGGGTTFNLTNCPGLNLIPTSRMDPNAIKLMQLYPAPTNSNLFSNYTNSPLLVQNEKQFDVRLDVNPSQKDQLYYSFSYDDKPELIPSIFGGVADGGGFFQGNQTALSQHSALVWNHVFTPTTINVARAGLNYLHTTRNIPEAQNLNNVPGDYGILGIPQQKENGGLPAFGINGLQTLGGNAFLPSDEVTSTIQVTDDFTKIYGKHTFKMGFEQQHVKFSTLQPPWSRGEFDYGGTYTDIPNVGGGNTGRAQFLLTPAAASIPGGIDYVGGPNNVYASNIFLTDNGKNYWGAYGQDDWKVTSKLTLNLGLRWDFFSLVYDHHAAQANFVPFGPPTGSAAYIIPQGNPIAGQLSASFTNQLAASNIDLLVTNKYGKGLGNSQKSNFAPRFGFAYQATSKLVARGGIGIFFNGFENRGYSPNLGENYPFQFSFNYSQQNDANPINAFAGCATATPAGGPTLETGFSCIPLTPSAVTATGLQLRGIQFDYKTPYSIGSNFTLQYELARNLSVQAGYVGTFGRHLEVFPGSNNPTALLPPSTTLTGTNAIPASQGGLQWPLFGQNASYAATWGSSYYHGLQTNVQKKFDNGLSFLATYTWSKVRSDALDLLNGFSGNGYRAPYVPGVGIHSDYGLANFDIRNVFHFSGGYELPFGHGKKMLGDATGVKNAVVGGWAVQWVVTLQGGQPFKIDCPSGTGAGVNCYAFVLPGQNPRTSLQFRSDGNPAMLNAAAFAQSCEVGSPGTPTGCVAETTPAGVLGGNQPSMIEGPGFHRWDLSFFKNFQINERFRLEFRSEFFNILNHPNFNQPNFGGNGVVAVSGSGNFTNASFGEIGSTRDNPLDPRQIQFALKLYF